MVSALVLLLIMTVFFGGMYLYCYATTTLKDKRDARIRVKKREEKQRKFEQIKASIKDSQKAIKEKYNEAQKRSEEIRKQIEMVQANQ